MAVAVTPQRLDLSRTRGRLSTVPAAWTQEGRKLMGLLTALPLIPMRECSARSLPHSTLAFGETSASTERATRPDCCLPRLCRRSWASGSRPIDDTVNEICDFEAVVFGEDLRPALAQVWPRGNWEVRPEPLEIHEALSGRPSRAVPGCACHSAEYAGARSCRGITAASAQYAEEQELLISRYPARRAAQDSAATEGPWLFRDVG